MSTKTDKYVEAVLMNPEFIKMIARTYGTHGFTRSGDHDGVFNCTMEQIAKAVSNFEYALNEIEEAGK